MMKCPVQKLLLLACITLLPITAWANDAFDFRNARWGMTKAEVKASESARLSEENKYELIYILPNERGADEVQLWYEFNIKDLTLHKAFISYEYRDPANQAVYAAYAKLKNEVAAKYGTPDPEEEFIDDRHAPAAMDINDKAAGVQGGYMLLKSVWRLNRSKIELSNVPYGMPAEPSIFIIIYYYKYL